MASRITATVTQAMTTNTIKGMRLRRCTARRSRHFGQPSRDRNQASILGRSTHEAANATAIRQTMMAT